ncbi:unnamed protein product [Oikopleura dioica]|uniref:Uncharacterized protein n=1 Tax=Oikopleura dioica TaxID=34765 RepID=E4Z177_OIKDI|nr:unnamed protein product [Oikopleura dioica]
MEHDCTCSSTRRIKTTRFGVQLILKNIDQENEAFQRRTYRGCLCSIRRHGYGRHDGPVHANGRGKIQLP